MRMRMIVRGGWSPLQWCICEIVNSVDQGNFTFVREKAGNLKKSMTVASMWTN